MVLWAAEGAAVALLLALGSEAILPSQRDSEYHPRHFAIRLHGLLGKLVCLALAAAPDLG